MIISLYSTFRSFAVEYLYQCRISTFLQNKVYIDTQFFMQYYIKSYECWTLLPHRKEYHSPELNWNFMFSVIYYLWIKYSTFYY